MTTKTAQDELKQLIENCHKWHQEIAYLKSKRKNIFTKIDRDINKTALDIRQNPNKYGYKSVTEKLVVELTKANLDTQKLQDELLDIEYQLNLLVGKIASMKYELELIKIKNTTNNWVK